MKTLLQTFFFFLLVTFVINAQLNQQNVNPKFNLRSMNTTQKNVNGLNENVLTKTKSDSTPSFYKRKSEWQHIIDSTWGQGQSATEQLSIFDFWWSSIDHYWAGFPNYSVNWDSVRNVYRPQIGSGLSRGRFSALMSRMWISLMELHSYIYDPKVDTVFGVYNSVDDVVNYRRGVPLLLVGPALKSFLGANVAPLSDSTNLVYRVSPYNPLGLEPGDIILGYEGIPWKQLYLELINGGIPIDWYYSWTGSTPESMSYFYLMSVGNNWGLFDTIDVVKYASGDTIHLPTKLLEGYTPTLWQSDQVPIAGVQMPEAPISNHAVSWGVIQGTNIGYIYIWDWASSQTSQLFSTAVNDLCHIKKVDGLVLDFRMNWGGEYINANAGLSQIFNIDPTTNLRIALRNNSSNHMGFSLSTGQWGFTPNPTVFDRPIAVLIGPGCFSGGDFNAFRMDFHPMVRFFGKQTNGAFVYGGNSGSLSGGWQYNYITGTIYSNLPGEGYLIHKGVQPDEEVWLTPDGVAKGEDDVVKRALEWMNNLVYPHNIMTDKSCYTLTQDTVHLATIIENPNSHQISARAYIKTINDILVDSVDLSKQTVNGNTENWVAKLTPPTVEEFYTVSVKVFDQTSVNSFTLPNASRFTTAGPLKVDSITYIKNSNMVYVKPYVRNYGTSRTISGAKIRLYCSDPWITSIPSSYTVLPNIAAGVAVLPSNWILISVNGSLFTGKFNFKTEITSNDYPYWVDSTKLIITGIADEINEISTEYSLAQNYPNPFNPSTKISWQLPVGSQVTLKVYDILGREVATLVNEYKPAGKYETEFSARGGSASGGNAIDLSSGVYFYQLKAGNYLNTKKMILLK